MCPNLHYIVKQLRPDTHSNPLIRIGLHTPCRESLLSVACTVSAYHAARCDSKEVQLNASGMFSSADSEFIRSVFGHGFKAEADEVYLDCRPPHTVNFAALDVQPA